MLDAIKIVLVEPSHPGNIGATARVMKNMGLTQLVLVNPKQYPDDVAFTRAGRAMDVLETATITADLTEALADAHLVIGTSARDRSLDWPVLSPAEAAEKCAAEASHQKIAFVFGRERIGLMNDELQQCHFHLQIPTHPAYPSLNLASAVQIVCYELYKALGSYSLENAAKEKPILANSREMESFYKHLEDVLVDIEFLDPSKPKHLMARLRRLYGRAMPDAQELNILRGMLTAIQGKLCD